MTARLSVPELVTRSWQGGVRAARPNLAWLGLLMLAGGGYSAALHSTANLFVPLLAALLVFGAGVRVSLGLYQTLLGTRTASLLPLAHANLAVYLAFLLISVFIGFFLAVLPGILIEARGQYDLGSDASPARVEAAMRDMLPTPYGAVFVLVCLAGGALLAWIALRLVLFGAATVDQGTAHVFRTFGWTRGQVLPLGLAALATHVLPFLAALSANVVVRHAVPDSIPGYVAEGALAILLFTPFLLSGHGLAAEALRRLKPLPAELSSSGG